MENDMETGATDSLYRVLYSVKRFSETPVRISPQLFPSLLGLIWVFVKVMVPFWIPSIIRHLIFRVATKGP